MEEIYGMGSSVDFSDYTNVGSSVSPESFVCFPQFVSSYCTYYSPPPAGGFGDKISSSLDDIVGLMPPVASVLDSSSSPYFSGDGEGRTFYTSEISSAIKAKIASHPRYPSLVEAYIDCRKVGAPPEIASVLEEIRRENDALKGNSIASCLGVDPELDEFMESYFEILVKYKADLTKPFEEATMFLNKIERQLRNLCNGTTPSGNYPSSADEHAGSSNDDELSGGEVEAQNSSIHCPEHDLKEKLLRKYSGYLGSLKREFSKKKKKGKLPKEARQTLLEWWNSHYKWPYPTEADKISLAESTGLHQKQINNWFINQRKRHWKPSENVQFSAIESLSMPFYEED